MAAQLGAAIARTQGGDSSSTGQGGSGTRGESSPNGAGARAASTIASTAAGAATLPPGSTFTLPAPASGAQDATVPAGNPLLSPQAEAALPGQIIQSIRVQMQNGGGQATIRLDPAHLGELTVSVRVDQGTVNAQLHADTPQVRAWIQQHAQDLRGALEQQGLRLGQMAVTAINPDGQQDAPQDQPPPRRSRQAPTNGAQFMVSA
jgi:flagellar hook-length control protein FliK